MAWNTELVEQLRVIINDVDSSNYVWTDLQLQKFIAIAVLHVQNDLTGWGFSATYTVTLSGTPTVTPDPTEKESAIVQSIIVMKAALLISQGELKKTSATAGLKIVDDKSTYDATRQVTDLKSIVSSYEDIYDDMIDSFKDANKFTGRAIIAPYASSEGDPFVPPPIYGGRR